MLTTRQLFNRRKQRLRYRLKERMKNSDTPRMSIFRSNKHIYAQIISDKDSKTLVSASSIEKDFKHEGKAVDRAEKIGEMVGKRAVDAGIKRIVFDRGGFMYHGRVRALAEGARRAGLEF